MEATARLPFTHVTVAGGRLAIDGLVVEDETAVRLASERDDPARFVVEAIEIGARVLDREQAGANAEFVRAEFERAARELDGAFVERARTVAERLDRRLDEVFGAEHGELTRALARHFGDESSVAVQHRVRAALTDVAAQMREDLRRQLSADSDSNPLAVFQRTHLAATRQIADRQAEQLTRLTGKLEEMKLEIAELRAERERRAQVAAVEERGTAKGRTYEEAVAEAIDALAATRGDLCEAVGDVRGEGGRKGDVVVAVEGCSGPPRGAIVFEAKTKRMSRKEALAELDAARETRGADYAVLVVPADERLPARTHPLREFGGDKLFVAYDPEEGSTLALEVAYGLARARVLTAGSAAEGVDCAALGAEVERARGAMEDVRRIKSQLTNATTGIEEARRIVDAMAGAVRGHLAAIERLLAQAGAEVAGDA